MLYNQPFDQPGVPNAPYVNGNPSTGTQGSIPPAASIEYPQREIVNLITDAGITPSNSDLHQLAKGVQSGQLIYGNDVGAVNQVSLSVQPPVLALRKGMTFLTVFAFDNTGPATCSVSGLAFVEIVRPSDRASLQPLDLRAGAFGCLAYDGTKFQLAWSQTPIGAAVYLTTNLDYYVGGAGASDTNDGTTATVSGVHGPFATLQKAMNTIANFNLNGHNINIHVANGSYGGVALSRMAGSGVTIWTGNQTTPSSCAITGVNMSGIVAANAGPTHSFRGFALGSGGTFIADPLCGANVSGTGTTLELIDIQWNTCNGSHLAVSQAGVASMGGKWIINGSANGGNPQMTSGWHVFCVNGAIIQPNGSNLPQLNIITACGGQNGGGFAEVSYAFYEAFFSSISGAANWSGIKYLVNANAVLNVHGSGTSYLPGSVAGSVSTGGQYF